MDPQIPAADRRPARSLLRFSLAGLLFAVLCWAGMLVGTRYGIQAPRLNPDPTSVTVIQRSSQEIPGLNGQAHVRIDDITRGQALLAIEDAAGKPLVAPLSVREHQIVPFKLKGHTYYLHVADLKNKLLGDDHAVFEIGSKDFWPDPSDPSASGGTSK